MRKSVQQKKCYMSKGKVQISEWKNGERRVFGRQLKNTSTNNQKMTRGVSSKLIRKNSGYLEVTYPNEPFNHKQTTNTPLNLLSYLKGLQLLQKGKIASPHLNKQMREVLITWMVELFHKFQSKLSHQTLFHSIMIVDVLLEKSQQLTIANLQLLGITSMFISSKYQEVYPLTADYFIEMSAFQFTKQQISQMQSNILSAIDFQLTLPTRYTFISHYQYGSQKKKILYFIIYVLELTLLNQWESTKQSQITQAAIFLALKVFPHSYSTSLSDPGQKILEIAWRIMAIMKEQQNGFISYIFDSQKYQFVGGIKLLY